MTIGSFLAAAAALGGCIAPPAEGDLWIVDRTDPHTAATDPSRQTLSPTSGTHRVELTAANHETVSFRFVVRVGAGPLDQPQLNIDPFLSGDSSLGPDVVQVFRMHRVRVSHLPGWHIKSIPPDRRDLEPLDVLVPIHAPRGGLPATMAPRTSYHFWVDVAVPKGTPGGVYLSRIELTSRRMTIGAVDVQLTVRPFLLPDRVDTPAIVQIDHRALFRHHVRTRGKAVSLSVDDWRGAATEDRLNALLGSTMRMLQRHRLTPVLHKLQPVVKLDAHGRLNVDWGQYDQLVEPWLDGRAFVNRVPLPVWPMPTTELVTALRHHGAGSTLASGSVLEQFLAECARHFEEKGWLDRSYAPIPGADKPDSQSIAWTHALSAAAHGADERIAVASRLWPQNLTPVGWFDYPATDFSEAVDVWITPAAFYDPDEMARQRAAGKRCWLSIDRPPYSGSISIHAPPAHQRVLSWQAYRLGAEALFVGSINGGTALIDDPTPEDCVGVDPNVLLYPGRPFGLDEPVPSVRLKHLRASLQDAAYRELLAEHGLEHVTAALARSLCPYSGTEAYRTHFADGRPNGWPGDEGAFDLARDIMAEELMRVVRGDRIPRRMESLIRTVTWRRFMLATRRLHLQVDGVRLRFRGTRDRWEAEAESSLTVTNGTRGPIHGTLRAVDLPDGWIAAESGQPLTIDAPNRSRHVTVVTRTEALPSGPGGVVEFHIELTTNENRRLRRTVRVACVTAVAAPRLPKIDGDLSDWPPGAINVASNFRLITAAPPDSIETLARAPHHATTGFVMRGGADLYVAINSELDPRSALPFSGHNRVRYEDLVPMGEELVELLFDPLNAGTRSPEDLYHIVIKPTGAYFTERGIRLDPPCGARSPWLADMEVATRVHDGRWTAELRIPLSAFGDVTNQPSFWGFNITRLDAARQEFSTWSGAVGNAYDPLSLGNLYLP